MTHFSSKPSGAIFPSAFASAAASFFRSESIARAGQLVASAPCLPCERASALRRRAQDMEQQEKLRRTALLKGCAEKPGSLDDVLLREAAGVPGEAPLRNPSQGRR